MSKKYMRVQKYFNKNGISRVPHSVSQNFERLTGNDNTAPVASMCTTGNPYQLIRSAEIGTVLDMYTELQRDDEPHDQLASQDDMDRF